MPFYILTLFMFNADISPHEYGVGLSYLIADKYHQVVGACLLLLGILKNIYGHYLSPSLPIVTLFDSSGFDEPFNYTEHSLLSSFLSLYPNIPKTLLKEHYRCHPKIIGFCNQKFYNNELIIFTDEKENEKPLVLYKTSKVIK